MKQRLIWLKEKVYQYKQETYALYYAYRDERTPWYAKVFSAYVVIRTLSPVDLIPDFIPGLGYLDDLILTPLGIYLALKMIPADVIRDSRIKAEQKMRIASPHARLYAILVILFWILITVLMGKWAWSIYKGLS
jgi:uncharacterized membrane protein YkvA (DUF1232 family)